MTQHREVPVKVNAWVDEGVVDLVSALSEIDGLVTIESCQGAEGMRPAFVIFRYGDWQQCGDLLFGQLLPKMTPELRAMTALRIEGYDADTASGSIRIEPSAVSDLAVCVRRLATPVRVGILVTGDAHRDAVAQSVMTARSEGMRMMRMPIAAKHLVATATVAAMLHRALTFTASAAISLLAHFRAKSHWNGSYVRRRSP